MPLDNASLRRMGISPQLAAYYARTGWLNRLAHGTYILPGDPLTAPGMLMLLQDRIAGLHLAGRSALAAPMQAPARDELVLMGDARAELPEWFTTRQPARYTSPRLFDWSLAGLSPEAGAALARQTVVDGRSAVAVRAAAAGAVAHSADVADRTTPGFRRSIPERAILELLYDVGTGESLADAKEMVASLRVTTAATPASAPELVPALAPAFPPARAHATIAASSVGHAPAPAPTQAPGPLDVPDTATTTTLHIPTLGLLLRCCTSIKAVRLLLTLARQTNLLDVRKLARDHSPRTGSPTRWMRRLPDGTLLSLRPYG
jgi:hypothetical protein